MSSTPKLAALRQAPPPAPFYPLSSTLYPLPPSRREVRHLLTLEAYGYENVAQAFEVGGREEVGREIEGEAGSELLELADQGGAVEGGDEADELFDLFGLQHRAPLLSAPAQMGIPPPVRQGRAD